MLFNKKTLSDMDFKQKSVIVRCDFNVPLDEKGNVADDKRIVAAIPTIKYLMEKKAKVILLSHLGRPKGQYSKAFSLAPVAKRISEILKVNVKFLESEQVVDDSIKEKVSSAQYGDVILLENTRFREEEKKNGVNFSKELASLGELYVNDAFGTAHRAHSSNVGIASLLPSCVGLLVEKELEIMGKAMSDADKPFTVILGGSKVSDKIGVIKNLALSADYILIGGGMMFTFLKATGCEIGTSIVEEDQLETARTIIEFCKERGVQLILPSDVVVADSFSNGASFKSVSTTEIPPKMMGLDIGEETVKLFADIISKSKTVLWNGPMGVFEMEKFAKGTLGVAKALAGADATTIIGGGDSASAIHKFGLEDKMTHISTGGGASLKLFEGGELPGIECISNKGEM
ncbi:MAG: phosphoglycerate kinase [Peptostreptococcaceae bacterium]|nr:phosphoglycerate kinase [Peptostreptococcaceae bacterium]